MRRLIRAGLALAMLTQCALARADAFDLTSATIADLNVALESGALTSEQLVRKYLERIAAYDKQGPTSTP